MSDTYDDSNSMSGRLSRYARVGVAVGGLGLQFAANRVLGPSSIPSGTPRS
ncbi:hypothetical protein [Hankyongella ginsenosidimutans]|uniref:hypothetical protein n=1 Tax=Hankyongella ginsenosidimutans TaxID=1763828 RepID=UPI001CA34CA5|nr:hypothetical protein [Hankyongella ginsenosidimutans]